MEEQERELSEQEKARILDEGKKAKAFLDHPIIDRFFLLARNNWEKKWQSLPVPAKHEEYIALHVYIVQLDTLQQSFARLVKYAEDLLERERIDKEFTADKAIADLINI